MIMINNFKSVFRFLFRFKCITAVTFIFFLCSCESKGKVAKREIVQKRVEVLHQIKTIDYGTIHFTNGFDYPVGKPNAKGYYNAQKFGENTHLGDDWNGVKGGNSDLGDPIYAIANGYVTFAKDVGGGWGNVIRVVHYLDTVRQVESLYAHCDNILITQGTYVEKGTQIGTIGNNHGHYWAHLHLEIRDSLGMPLGGGYSEQTQGYTDPTAFIKTHRK